jgi:hypothetical protein
MLSHSGQISKLLGNIEDNYFERAIVEQVDRILDDCPAPDTDILPLPSPLSYSGFGYFYDFMNGAVEKLDTVLDPCLKNEVDLLLDAMCAGPMLRILAPGPRRFIHGVLNGSQATTNGHILAG